MQVAVSETAPGTAIDLGILRDGKPQTIKVTVGEFHNDTEEADNCGSRAGKARQAGTDGRGSLARRAPAIERSGAGTWRGHSGACAPASPADDAGLAPGDVILEVNRHPVTDADNFVSQVHCRAAGQGHSAAGVVERRPATASCIRRRMRRAECKAPPGEGRRSSGDKAAALIAMRRLAVFFDGLRRQGFSQSDIDQMSKVNPARLLGLEEAAAGPRKPFSRSSILLAIGLLV